MFFEPDDQGAELSLLTLGVVGDDRVLLDQPQLKEGIHLRWAFERDRGFPWYGFYLFRRRTLGGGATPVCVSTQLGGFAAGEYPSPLVIPLGSFRSALAITLTEAFAPATTVEVDLSGLAASSTFVPRDILSFEMDPALPSRRVEVTIGFLQDFPPPGGGTGGGGTGGGPGGGTGGGGSGGGTGGGGSGSGGGLTGLPVGASATDACCCDHQDLFPVVERVLAIGGGLYRAWFGYNNLSTTLTSVPVGERNRFFPDPPNRGQPVLFRAGRRVQVFSVDFDGRPLSWRVAGRIVTVSAADATGDDPGGDDPGGDDPGGDDPGGDDPGGDDPGGDLGDGIVLTALRGGFVVARTVISGLAGQVVTAAVDALAIDTIQLTSGPARLIDLCVTRTTDGLGDGWEPVPGFPQPMCLPLHHADYPCSPGAGNEADARAIAIPRISYDSVERWNGTPFSDLYSTLVEIVQDGPAKGITDHLETVVADPDASDPASQSPQVTELSSLDLLLQASIDPAVAQMLGLYWVDDTASFGQSHDYLLVADHVNAGGGSLATIQQLVAAEDYTSLDGCWAVGVFRSPSPRLASPATATVFSLPVAAFPSSVPGDPAGMTGLTWDIPLSQSSKLFQTSSILFHLRRADLGSLTPIGPGAETADELHNRLNPPRMPGQSLVGETGPQPAGWPSQRLFGFDGPLADGWYSYKLNGIDLFGRYSALSPAARWFANDSVNVLNDFAVHIVDTFPPPPPTQVQAWVLDPLDPFVINDAAYNDWPAQFRSNAGLRVRWLWTGHHIRQAPDLKEFRVYFNIGTARPVSRDGWFDRIAVVAAEENIVSNELHTLSGADGASLQGAGATASGNTVTLDGSGSLDGISIDGLELELSGASGRKAFLIVALDVAERRLTLDAAPVLSGSSDWRIALRERTYEIFLPNVGRSFTLPLVPSLAEPILYGLVGVSAADDKADTPDEFDHGALAGRPGNESAIGGPATVYRVRRALPDAPPLPPFPQDRLLATRADFYSRSYFTVHWSRLQDLFIHVFRAMDQALFQIDARKGFAGTPRASELDSVPLFGGWDAARKQAAATEINGLSQFSAYGTLSNDALRLLASLPSNVDAFTRLTRAPLGVPDPGRPGQFTDPDVVGPSDSANPSAPNFYVPNSAERGSFLDTLDGRAQNRYFYRTAAVDAAQNLGPLGEATPPVYLPETRVPPTVRFTRAVGLEEAIELAWPDRADSGIAEYILLRSDDPNVARDAGLMLPIRNVAAGSGTDGEIIVIDGDVAPFRDIYYRLVAAGATGVRSQPSAVLRARALKTSTSFAPELVSVVATTPAPAFLLTWSAGEELSVLVQRRTAGRAGWSSVTSWLPSGTTTFVDSTVLPDTTYQYRLRGRDVFQIQTDLSNVLPGEPA